jgi:large subunit ribosomal protein L9
MKVYLKKDVPRVGLAGEIITVPDGYARNFLFPKQLGVEINDSNINFYQTKIKTIVKRKEVLATETSMLAEKIKNIKLSIKRKLHDNNKLYAAISAQEVADALVQEGIKVAKNQVIFPKTIKEKGEFDVVIKLSARLQPMLKLKITAEKTTP